MKKLSTLVTLWFLINSVCFSQNWAKVTDVSNAVYTLNTDTVEDVLYIGGPFTYLNGDTVFGIVKYDGTNYIRMGCGLEWDCSFTPGGGNIVVRPNKVVRYNGDIYMTGNFTKSNNIKLNGLAKWDGSAWQAQGTGLKNGIYTAMGTNLKVINNELYVCASNMDTCAGVPVNSIAKFNGTLWTDVHNFPKYNIGTVSDVEMYNGELYVGGNFYDSINGDIWRITKWSGSQWVSVGGGIKGGIAGVSKMLVYKGLLYVAGMFESAGTNTFAKGIATWDGTKWENVGGGIEYQWGARIFDMKVHNDKLYVVGGFDEAGGTPIREIAVWDGTNWCGFGVTDSTIDGAASVLGFYQDTMYIGGGFFSIDGDSSVNRIAKYIGAGADTCGNKTGIGELPNTENIAFSIYPNPAQNYFNVEITNPDGEEIILSLYNLLGEKLYHQEFSSRYHKEEISTQALAKGVYIISLQAKSGQYVKQSKVVVQ
jgi:hypothetical protein